MRMLWISFLLIGSITCFPQQQQQQGSGGGQPWWWFASSSGQDPSRPSDENPAGQSSGSGSYPGLYYTNTAGRDGSSGLQQQSSSQDSQHGALGSSGPYQSTEESWSSSSDTSGEDEPVFSPVEDQDQVYAFKSRSRYNRKRLSFNQFRYTPTEPLFPRGPVFHGTRPQPQDPVKGGY